MSSASGPNVSDDGLVFAYDMSNSKKSWKGAPTTNLLTNGHFENGNHVSQFSSGGSYGSYQIDYFPENPGNSDYVLRQNGGSNGEYEMGVTLSPSTTYCVSCWVAYTPDSDMSTQILHTRWYYTGGNSTTGGAGTLYETKQMGGFTWERRYVTFTTPSTATGSFQWYLGYSTGGTKGFRYLTDLQIEAGTSVPTPFVDGTRSNTQAILDLTNNNTITATSLTYASDNTFSFNGSNFITIPNVQLGNGNIPWTVSAWVKTTTTTNALGNGSVMSNSSGGPVYSMMGVNNGKIVYWTYQGAWIQKLGIGKTVNDNVWHMLTWVNYNNFTMDMYVDGLLDSNVANSTSGNNNPVDRIGGSWSAQFVGSISAVSRYTRALTAAEVQQNFNATRSRYGV